MLLLSPHLTHTGLPLQHKFKQALRETRNEANANMLLDLGYKVTFLMVLIVPKLDMVKFSILILRRYKSSTERKSYY